MRASGLAAALAWAIGVAAAQPGPADAGAPAEAEALSAAEAWLGLLDAGKYEESWDAAAPLFKVAVPKDQWTFAALGARGSLGKLLERKRAGSSRAETLPGAPDGTYVVVEFKTTFANKASAVERVTMARTAAGEWRAAGYFIR